MGVTIFVIVSVLVIAEIILKVSRILFLNCMYEIYLVYVYKFI